MGSRRHEIVNHLLENKSTLQSTLTEMLEPLLRAKLSGCEAASQRELPIEVASKQAVTCDR